MDIETLIVAEGGHGPFTSGKRTPLFPDGTFVHEHQFNYPTSCKFLDLCKSAGFETLNVSDEFSDVPLKTRTVNANNVYEQFMTRNPNGVVIYVSFHYNALNGVFDNKKGGISTFHYPGAKDSQMLDEYVQEQLINGAVVYNRGVRSADFHVLRETHMTAILIEAGFMDKLSEAKLMLNVNYQNEVAIETFNGCLNYLKKECGVIMPTKDNSIPNWKIDGEKWLRDNNITNTVHNPLEKLDFGTFGMILKQNYDKMNGGK